MAEVGGEMLQSAGSLLYSTVSVRSAAGRALWRRRRRRLMSAAAGVRQHQSSPCWRDAREGVCMRLLFVVGPETKSTCIARQLRYCCSWRQEPTQWLTHSPPTKAIRARSPAGPLPDLRIWGSCWMMPLAGDFSGHSYIPRPCTPSQGLTSCSGMTGT
ncbi:hypothetical protein PR048_026704 [Dryococelus australis]|uniref:Uncharacterized protein n=1 Tax=Dryococelus australis TaxID=614101 RepID=A0ABQ9GM44_9NEOP|nr:hypothetical protein PR048_026704 [Dryococelus australis]